MKYLTAASVSVTLIISILALLNYLLDTEELIEVDANPEMGFNYGRELPFHVGIADIKRIYKYFDIPAQMVMYEGVGHTITSEIKKDIVDFLDIILTTDKR